MRRSSVVFPLVLILIGIAFLVRNIRPDLPIFETLVSYWPFLLIAWGLLRLIEITIAWMRESPLPALGISGGEWAMVVMLTLLGSSIWGVQRFSRYPWSNVRIGGWDFMGNAFDFPLEARSLKAGATPRVVIDNPRGSVRIVGIAGEEVKASGRKSVRAMDRDEANKADRITPLDLQLEGATVVVRGNQDRASDAQVTMELEIQVPRGASVECRGRNNDWDLSDLNGAIDISGDRSSARIQNVGGAVRVNTKRSDLVRVLDGRGDIEVKGAGRDIELENIEGQVTLNGSFSGETSLRKIAKPVRFESNATTLRLEKVPGELQITLGKIAGENLVGPLVLENRRTKDIRLTDVSNSVDITLDRGDIELRQSKLPLGRVTLHTRAGDVEVALPEKAQMSLNASTERGNITNDFSTQLHEVAEHNGGKLSGAIGAGPEVRLTTDRGHLTVRRFAAEDAASPVTPEPKAPALPKMPPTPPTPPAKAVNQ
jgi:DUF4097 and DUF4098 domain-containing protein YvlB